MNKVKPYLKAGAGFLAAGLVAYLGASDNGVNGNEWLQILVAALGGSGLVYIVPNKDPLAKHQAESVQPPERGESLVGILVAVAVFILVVYLLLLLLGAVHR